MILLLRILVTLGFTCGLLVTWIIGMGGIWMR